MTSKTAGPAGTSPTIASPRQRNAPTPEDAATDSALLRIGAVLGITGVLLQIIMVRV